jgi:phospholipid/cholesterol/gamma-HCH transport system substrate-binding protein
MSERLRLRLSVIGLLLTTVVCVVHLLTGVLDTPLLHRPTHVTVHLTRTGGLYEGSAVTYRGTRVGTVDDIGIGDDGEARATLTLWPGSQVPRASRAAVRSLSPVGEQFLDFRPDTAGAPYLSDGDEVSARAVDLPTSLARAADGLDRLLGQVDPHDVRVVLRELDAATAGSGGDLRRLLRAADELSGALEESWPDTADLLRNSETVGELFAAQRGRLASVSASARRLASWLREFDPEFRRLLRTTPRDLDTTGDLAHELRPVLPPLLDSLYRTTDLLADREPHLRSLGTALSYGARRFASAFSSGWLRVDLLLQGQRNCDYGSTRHSGADAHRHDWNRDGHCGPGVEVWRGARHVPPPLDR